jgi:hypothetical protein
MQSLTSDRRDDESADPEATATVVRVAVSHYLVRSDDSDEFLWQLRYAARVNCTPVHHKVTLRL